MINRIANKIKRELSKPPIDISDDYINWLCYANAGMLNRGNLYCFNHAIEHLPSNAPIIEIGSFCGLSTNIMNYYLSRHNKTNALITCDKWEFEGAKGDQPLGEFKYLTHDQYREFVKGTFKRNVQTFSNHNLPHTVEMFSDEFFERWGKEEKLKDVFDREIQLGGPISFAYIDGNHTYEFAKHDFENTDKYLEVGGFVLFDDSNDASPYECVYLMKEILKDPRYELVIVNPNYLFKKIK